MYSTSNPNTWGAWKKRVNQWKASAYRWVSTTDGTSTSTTDGTGNQMALFANQFYQGTSATSSAITTNTANPTYTFVSSTPSTTAATTTSNIININASATTTGTIIFSSDTSIGYGREITEDEKIAKLVGMEEQLQKMKEALDEALYMSRKLMSAKHDEKKMARLERKYATRIEAIEEHAEAIVEEAEEIMVFSG